MNRRPVTAARWDARQWGLLCVLAGNMLIDALEVSVLLPALPQIAGDLQLGPNRASWLMGGFALGFAAFLLAGPALAARWGRRRVYLLALLVFVVASVVGGLAVSATVLIATRVVKGACAALTAPTGLAIIGSTFGSAPDRRRAISVYSLFGAAGFTVGLLLSAGFILADWRWIFVFTAPVALVLMIFAARLIPSGPRPPKRPYPWRLLRHRLLLRSAAGAALLNGTYLGLLLLTTFTVQDDLGWTSWQTALAFLPGCLPPLFSSLLAGRMVETFGSARLIALGAACATAGYALRFASFAPESYLLGLLPTLVLVGAAFVFSFAALNMQAVSGIAEPDRPVAVALYQCGVQCGAVVMLPAVASSLEGFGTDRPALLVLTLGGALALAVALRGVDAVPGKSSIL